jgi:phage protein U
MPLIQLSKAMLREKTGINHVMLAFNPQKVQINTSAEWKSTPTVKSKTSPPVQYVGTKNRTLSMELVFDSNWLDYFTGGGDVARDVEQLLSWTDPKQGLPGKTPNPPILVFSWGIATTLYFDCYLKSVNASYTEFNPLGSPTRAEVSLTLQSIPADPPPTNPSSGGVPGRRTHVMAAGDTLHSVAAREYGRASLWRGLAEANNIDDPLRVAIGTSILIPPREDAELLS